MDWRLSMYSYRVTKYNPYYRNKDGIFLKDDWTSVNDVGKLYGEEVEYSEYLLYENAYIFAVRTVMTANRFNTLQIVGIEKCTPRDYSDIPKDVSSNYIDLIMEGTTVDCANIDFLIRLILREMMWGKLICENMYVHFGYDYYMYIGCS